MPPGHQSAGCGLNTHHVTRQQLIALVAITLMWGVNWPMMKYSLRELSPLWDMYRDGIDLNTIQWAAH